MEEDYLQGLEWVAVDTETTGLNPWVHELLEIGAVRFKLSGIVEKFQVLIKPNKKQDPRARAVHNISDEEISEKGVQLADALRSLYGFVADIPLVFHNAPFDISYINLAAASCKLPELPNLYYDSLFLSRKSFPERKSHSLASIRKEMKIDTGKAHRALSDAEATALLFCDILKTKQKGINSKKGLHKFLRYHRRLNNFTVSLPKNFDEIEKYFKSKIRRKESIKVRYRDKENQSFFQIVQPQEIMVFNQRIFIRAIIQFSTEEKLIPLHQATFYDTDKGPLNFGQRSQNTTSSDKK